MRLECIWSLSPIKNLTLRSPAPELERRFLVIEQREQQRKEFHWETDIETAITVALITVAGGWFGVWAHHRLAMWRENRAIFSAASAALRSTFSNEVAVLTNPAASGIDVRELLLEAFTRHSNAVQIFRHHLHGARQRQFDRAWQQYHSGHEFDAEAFGIPPKDRLFMIYFSMPSEADGAAFAIKQIHEILRFAKET